MTLKLGKRFARLLMPNTLYIRKYPLISVRSGKLYRSKSAGLDFSMRRMLKEPTITVHPLSLSNSVMSLRMSTAPHILASVAQEQQHKNMMDTSTTTDIRCVVISDDMLSMRIVWKNTEPHGHTHSVTVNTVLNASRVPKVKVGRHKLPKIARAPPHTVANSPGKYSTIFFFFSKQQTKRLQTLRILNL